MRGSGSRQHGDKSGEVMRGSESRQHVDKLGEGMCGSESRDYDETPRFNAGKTEI